MVRSIEQARDELLEVVLSRDAALVIGAGASVSSGGPTSPALVAELKERFAHATISETASLLEAGTAICSTPPYGRQDLVKAIVGRVSGLAPHVAYQQLPQLRWRALFTTNYDDLIEKAYSTPSREQTIQAINLPFDRFTVPRENALPLFYLQGSIREPITSVASPVVCWADFIATAQQLGNALQLLQNVLLDGGRVIYVGYSFNDFFLDRVLDEAARRLGAGNMPYGYAILRDWPKDSRHVLHRTAQHRILPIEGTFEEFADLLALAAERRRSGALAPKSAPAAGKAITVTGRTAVLPEVDAAVISESFELVSDADSGVHFDSDDQRLSLTRAFLRGESLGWTPYAAKWTFCGSTYERVKALVKEGLERAAAGESGVILIHGPAGLGKSVMARQIAFDAFTEIGIPAMLAKSTWIARPDFKALDRFCEDLEDVIPDDSDLPPVLVVVDRAELLERSMPQRAVSYLRSKGRRVVVVLFARTNEYFRQAKDASDLPNDWGRPTVLSLDGLLRREDIIALVHHVSKLGVWRADRITDERFWIAYVEKELGARFFDAIYSLVEQTQEPLRERVWSEYQNLSPIAQKAYLLIAAVHQFAIGLKMEILMRAMAIPFDEFETNVIKSDARDILFSEHQTSDLNIFFRGRSRIISEVVFRRALPEPGAQLQYFKDIIEATNPNELFGIDELDALRVLLVQVLGPSGYDKRFSLDQVAALFDLATSRIEDDVLEHHFGIVEQAAGRLSSARTHLEKALELSASLPYDLATLRESPQNIENSLARVIGDLALEELRKGSVREAEELFQEAREHFLAARTGAFPNAAAYDAHGRMLLKRALRLFEKGKPERSLALADALDVVAEGIDNVNPEYKPDLVSLQTKVLEELGLDDTARGNIEQLAKGAASPEVAKYELLLARLLTKEGVEGTRGRKLRNALSHTVRACEADPSYAAAWMLRAEIFKTLYPTDFSGLIDVLQPATKLRSDTLWALFELGVALFHLDQHEKARSVFDRLRSVSRGHTLGSGVIEVAGTRNEEEPLEYEGRVVAKRAGHGFVIQCADLAIYGELFFNPRAQRFYSPRIGDRVTFVVGFNYKGIVADEVRKL